MESEAHDPLGLLPVIADSVPALLSYIDGELRYQWANRTYERWFGQSPGAIPGRHVQDVLGEQAWQAVRPYMERALAGEVVVYEQQLPYRDSGPLWVRVTYTPHVVDQRVVGFVVHVNDIGEQKHAEARIASLTDDLRARVEALRDSEAEYRALFEMASVGAAEADEHGRFIRVNSRFCEITGYGEAELQRRSFSDITHPDDRAVDRGRWRSALEGPGTWSSEKRYVQPNGEVVWVLVTGRVVQRQGQPAHTFAHIVDITDLKRIEDALRREHQQKDEFLAMLAHELRNPLAPIRSAVEILQLRPPQDPALLRIRDVIARQAEQLARLVDDLLDLSRITRGTIELRKSRVEIRQVVETAVETCQPLVSQKGHVLDVEIPAEPIWLEADPTRLSQVIANLLNNAAKYTDPGGRIRVEASRDGDQVVVRIADNGVGIEPELQPRVFDMFTQADRSGASVGGGLGIGLTIVRQLVGMHEGSVEVSSPGRGQGSVFTVRLPALAQPATTRDAPEAAKSEPVRGTCRVLVIDDNQDAAEMLAELISQLGQPVRTAFTGEEGLRAAELDVPDLALIDLGMPAPDGFEVARRLRADPRTEGVYLVALTGWGELATGEKVRQAGFDRHLVKPLELDALSDLLSSRMRVRDTRLRRD